MLNYNAPAEGVESSINGADTTQMNTFKWLRTALIDAKKEQFFMPLASAIDMPKHMGKKIKRYQWVPLLDRRNINDQGIDAEGLTTVDGNLYGSSKDIGTIVGKLPKLGENGGRVNRIGFTRLELEGSIEQFGFFYEFTRDAIDFDSEENILQHLSRETIKGANEITETLLQMDLLSSAGVILRAGAAITDAQITGEETVVGGAVTVPASVVTYENFSRMDQILTENRCAKHTTIITGSSKIDTRTLGATRVVYVGPEIKSVLEKMRDRFGNPAFIPVHQYGAAATLMTGEIGAIGAFRIIEVPEMLHWAGVGAEATEDNPGFRTTDVDGDEHYDVFPILFVGNESFNTIGFQSGGSSFKFDIITKMPGRETADRNDPFGKSGFSSLSFWYGFLCNRPEWIGLIKTVAEI